MKTPRFWNDINILSILLYPVSLLYLLIAKLKFKLQTTVKFNKKIICIGNVTVGGAGKTPIAIALGKLLIKNGYKIAYVCKNYSGSLKGPKEVSKNHSSEEVIDEALLLAKIAKTFVAKDRSAAIASACKEAVDFIICDDGLQNNCFHKDLSVLVIDGNFGFGNGLIFPSGPLRENISSALERIDFIFVIGKIHSITQNQIKTKKIFYLTPKFHLASQHHEANYVAFAGIAYPQKFFDALKDVGIVPIETISYGDHYQYNEKEIMDLIQKSEQKNARLITTEKDYARIPKKFHRHIDVLKMEINIESEILKYFKL